MTLDAETRALRRIQAKAQQVGLRTRARRRARQLAGTEARLHFSDQPKSIPRLHAEDAVAGINDKPYLPRRL